MGIWGKRREKGGADAAPGGAGGIRDLSESPSAPDFTSDLGPPATGAMAGAPPPHAATLSDEDDTMPQSGVAPPAPPYPAMGAAMQGPAPPAIPTSTFEPTPMPPGAGDLAMAAPAPAIQAAGGLERLDNVEQRLSDISRRVDLLDKSSDDVRNDISRIRDSIAQIEGDMRELTSLYDLISTQINPFIDTANMEERPAVALEQSPVPDLDALFEPTPELSAEQRAGLPELVTVPSEAAKALPEQSKEGGAEAARKTPRLAKIGADASCHLALMEWIKFLLDRVNRNEIPSLLSFYQRIGWIAEEIKEDMVEIIRGIGAVAGEPAPSGGGGGPTAASGAKDAAGDIVIAYGKEQARELKGPAKGAPGGAARPQASAAMSATWRLTPDDHIASLMYIEWIRSGGDLDRDKLEEIRREVYRLRSGLDGFFSL